MSNPLLSCFYKLYRSSEHLDSLSQEIAAFLEPDCYEIVDEFDNKGEQGEISEAFRGVLRRKVVFNRQPPLLRWGIIIGDIIQNMRSALDHVVFAISFSRNPAEFRDDRTTEFLICDDADTFSRPRRKNRPALYEIRGLPPDAQAIVEALQPYHRGHDFRNDPLRIVREMSNIDKHRNIHITTWSAHSIALDITNIAPGVRIHSHRVRPPGVIESGTVIAEIEFTSTQFAKGAMYMDRNFTFTVAFDEGTALAGKPVPLALYDLGLYVEGVVECLGRFVVE